MTTTPTLDITGDLPPAPDGYTRVVLVLATGIVPVTTAVLTEHDAQHVLAYVQARRVA